MAEVFPSSLIPRENPNLRLGIKSSLNSFRQIIASLYAIYTVVDIPTDVAYSEEYTNNGTTAIRLASTFSDSLRKKYANIDNICDYINDSPLFKSQIEALQVGIELFLHLGKISFVQGSRQERTGKERYAKRISFSDKMLVLDAYIAAYSKDEINRWLYSWLKGNNAESRIEIGLKNILSTFIIDCCYKIKKSDGTEIVFNIENIYKELEDGNQVLFKDGEIVGPMRVLNSYIDEELLPDVRKNKNTFIAINGEESDLKKRKSMMSISLDLVSRRLPTTDNASIKSKSLSIKYLGNRVADYLTALRTKPFMLLAGISGTGKSRIVRKLAQATVTEELQRANGYTGGDFANDRWALHSPANFELIQVKPNWHNSMDVIGYLSNIPSPHYVFTPFIEFIVKAWQHPEVPFFLCLDEMNLAPVEEYFAEFLSAIESRSFEGREYMTDPIIKPFNSFGEDVAKTMVNTLFPNFTAGDTESAITKVIKHFRTRGLTLPRNLIVIGTVNMDETTFSFSRKVLDRAMSVEMNEVNYDSFLTDTTDDDLKAIVKTFEENDDADLNVLLVDRHIEAREIIDDLGDDARFTIDYLKRINALLEGTPFKLGYRAANEALIYLQASQKFGQTDRISALDNFTLMKVLSRVEGDETKLKITDSEADKERIAKAEVNVDEAKQYGDLNILTALRHIITNQLGEQDKLHSVKKIDSMLSQLKRDHFVSFWN
jgi:hypothetical protein